MNIKTQSTREAIYFVMIIDHRCTKTKYNIKLEGVNEKINILSGPKVSSALRHIVKLSFMYVFEFVRNTNVFMNCRNQFLTNTLMT